MNDLAINDDMLSEGTTSPFLPGTNIQYAWDSTSIGWFKTCPRLYQYNMIDGWTSGVESVHLRFGIEYHQAIQEYEHAKSQGLTHDDAVHEVVRELLIRTADFKPDETTKAGKYKNRRNLLSLVIGYLDHYEDDPAETYIMANGKPAVELSFRFELDWGPECNIDQPYILCGHLDRVADFNGQLLVLDHKTTTTTLSSYYFDQYEPSNQMTLYTFAGQVVLNTSVKGVCVTGAQIMLSEPNRFVRGFTYRTPDQIHEWLQDLRILFVTAEKFAEMNYWPMNDTACDKFGGCRFRGICSKDPNVRETFLKSDFTKGERWNPLKSR